MSNIAPDGFGSTHLNPRIESYADLVYRTKSLLGWPSAPIEITDQQWSHIIDKAVEDFTEFEGNREEEYLVFCADSYTRNCGVKLDDLLDVGCNEQHCYETTVVETVTSTVESCELIQNSTAYLSTTPFSYPEIYNYMNPNMVPYSGVSGQNFYLYFDSDNPWTANSVCDANCIQINPVSSQWFLISANPYLSATNFDFVTNPILSTVLSSVFYDVETYGFYSVPLSALGDTLSAIPVNYYPLTAFYPEDDLLGPSVSGCINIAYGNGFVYPDCDTSQISSCEALTAQYGISPTLGYSTFSTTLSTTEGIVYDLSALNFSSATHMRLHNVPTCTTDGSIPLNDHDGIIGSYTICNSGFNTSGPMHVPKIQFFKDYKPPAEILYDKHYDWDNNGFTFSHYSSAYNDCVRHTPEKVKVDVTFNRCSTVTEVGTVSTTLSSNYDTFINRKRKVLGVFTADATSQGGYFGGGGDLLFNFDYALLANTFGYDLQGNRNVIGKQGYDLVTYHMARSFVEHSKKMLRYVTYQFNPKTQYLKITPEPRSTASDSLSCCTGAGINPMLTQCYMVGVYLEPQVQTILSSYFIKEYVLALAMVTLGRIRSTFGGVTLYGGATLTGDQLVQQGQEKVDKLLAELRDEMRYSAPPAFVFG